MQTVETLNEGLKRAYRITISAKDIDARVDGELKKVAPQIRMPGFRPGKVPPTWSARCTARRSSRRRSTARSRKASSS
jgi:FKBP-type peptidyl-prolyl cis-trans isomerase (trigger factor)